MTNFDLTVYVILVTFLILGFFKGGIKSILSLFKWYGAFLLSIILYPIVSQFVSTIISSATIASGVTVVGTYVAALIALSIVGGIIVAALGDNVGNLMDRALGVFIGIATGYVIVSSIHFVTSSIYQGNDPKWLKDGQSYEITKLGSDMLKGYFKDGSVNITKDLGFELGDKIDDATSSTNSQAESLKNAASEIDVNQIKEMARKLKSQGYSEQEVLDIIQSGNTEIADKIQDNKDTVIDTVKKNSLKLKSRQ